jgi:hypothetical protein
MPNRREFLQTGAVVSAIAMNGVFAGSAAAIGARPTVPLRWALYDDRYAEGRSFAAAAAAQGIATRALDGGDITRFWYDELDVLWRREPAAIAGLTQFGPMFVIEQLAAEARMRLTLTGEHRLARLTTALQAPGPSLIHYYTPLTVARGEGPTLDGPLYSWVVAPRERG